MYPWPTFPFCVTCFRFPIPHVISCLYFCFAFALGFPLLCCKPFVTTIWIWILDLGLSAFIKDCFLFAKLHLGPVFVNLTRVLLQRLRMIYFMIFFCHEVSIHSQHSDFIQSFSLHLPLTEIRTVQCFTYVCKTSTVEISKQQLVVNAHIKDKMNKSELRMKQVKQH